MGYQKVINLFENTSNQPYKFRTRNWVEINDGSRGTYNTNIQVKFKTTMLKSSICTYSDVYILTKEKITIPRAGYDAAARKDDKRNKEKYLKILLYLLSFGV